MTANMFDGAGVTKLDLSLASNRTALANRIKNGIDEYCAVRYSEDARTHLGASLIGAECTRYLQYVFRWFYKDSHTPRMQRLFNRGHATEHRFVEWLRGCGFYIWQYIDRHYAEGEDFEQFRCSAIGGHYGGSLDGQGIFPPGWQVLQDRILFEFKTSGTGSKWTELKDKGVQVAKPQHYIQMCTYGWAYQIQVCVYCAINKNDDDIHIEVVWLDWNLAAERARIAQDVISATTLFQRASKSPSTKVCAMCDARPVCHYNADVWRNCRSCQSAQAIDNGQWYCNSWNTVLDKSYIPQGCDRWQEFGK